jgi:hypothetical protein
MRVSETRIHPLFVVYQVIPHLEFQAYGSRRYSNIDGVSVGVAAITFTVAGRTA